MKFLAVLLVVGVVSAYDLFNQYDLDVEFAKFKANFGRQYETKAEEQQRKMVFASNYELIMKHNMEEEIGMHTYRLGVNNFADLTNKEFRHFYNGLRTDRSKVSPFIPRGILEFDPTVALNATVDWTTKGVVTPIKNQEQCGSCWAFSAVASIEGQHALKTGHLVSLSEQNIMDCSGPEGDFSCEGGLMDNAFEYVIKNHGIDTEASYPYRAIDEGCRFKRQDVGATITSFVDVTHGNEQALKQAVGTVGPISVAIDASNPSFQLYASGVYNEPDCSTTVLDHGVTAVGYGTLNGQDYWKVKNSWGTAWGEKGYILMSRNKQNQCGIATQASYPVV